MYIYNNTTIALFLKYSGIWQKFEAYLGFDSRWM